LEENLNEANLVLNQNNLSRINDALAKINVEGERYPEELEKRTGL